MNAIITEEDIREFIKDKAADNPLLLGVRFTSKGIEQAMIHTVDKFNLISPPTYEYTVEQFPSRILLLLGTVAHLLRGEAVNQASNQLAYSVEGVQVDDMNKAELFMAMAKDMDAEFMDLAKTMKVNQNIAMVYGVHPSEYMSRPRF